MVSSARPIAKPKYTLRLLPTDKLMPTPDNSRRPITQASVESLSRSIRRDGVLQPIVVRPHPDKKGRWEIRAGERRWRAARLAGLKEMPAIVRPLDDESAVTVTIAENLLRQNLHPLEEAAGLQSALDSGHDPKKLAARLGKSPAFVLRRASLTSLCTTWRDEVLRPDSDASRFSVQHLELISRLPAETQEMLAENRFHRVFARGFPTVQELRRVIDDGLRALVSMPWKLDDEGLDPKAGPCSTCPKRSGMQPELFDPDDAPTKGKISPTDRCLDPCCFERKMGAFVLGREAEHRSKHPDLRLVQVGFSQIGEPLKQAIGDRLTRVYDLRVVKPSKPGAIPVMQVDGPKAGSVVYIEGDSSAAQRNGTHTGKSKRSDVPMTLDERRERLQRRRDAFLVRRIEKELRAFTPERARTTAERLIAECRCGGPASDALALVLSFGTSTRADRETGTDTWSHYERWATASVEESVAKAVEEVVPVWTRRIAGVDGRTAQPKAADARRIGALLSLDIATIEAEARNELPEPKVWSSLRSRLPAADAQPRENVVNKEPPASSQTVLAESRHEPAAKPRGNASRSKAQRANARRVA